MARALAAATAAAVSPALLAAEFDAVERSSSGGAARAKLGRPMTWLSKDDWFPNKRELKNTQL